MDDATQQEINNEKKTINEPISSVGEDNMAAVFLSTATGTLAGGVLSSGPAIAVAGGGSGLFAYSVGMGAILTKVGCGSVAAAAVLTAIASGPVIGGLAGYSAYKAFKSRKKTN